MNIKSVKKMVMPEDGTTETNQLKVTDTNDKIYFVPKTMKMQTIKMFLHG
tara:strand:- start:298 stop:447 length:150 start_codon:yes stop_codon:yes gene_type:complete